jgi:hypothetical protein
MRGKKLLTVVICIWFSVPLLAQQGEPGNWLMYFGMNRLTDKISIHTEVQYRNHTAVPNNIEQLLLRTGVNVHLTNTAMISGGYAYIASHVYDSEQAYPESEEHRIWQQLITSQLVGRLKFEHRYRFEQRWVSEDYKNRLRYRLMLFLPINKPKIEQGTVFLGVYDEVFMNTKRTYFDRNRLYGAVGYQLNKSTQVQAGALHQQVGGSGKWYLQFALVFNPDLRKP